MSGNNLSVDGELRYIIQWFNEWSELQREDFLPIVVNYLTKDRAALHMNGVVNSLSAASFDEKPMSLFQCRVSRFLVWFLPPRADQSFQFINSMEQFIHLIVFLVSI